MGGKIIYLDPIKNNIFEDSKIVRCMALVSYYSRHMFSFTGVNSATIMCFGLSCLRASWLKESNPDAEQLFSMVAVVFIFWAKSHVRMTHNNVFLFLSILSK